MSRRTEHVDPAERAARFAVLASTAGDGTAGSTAGQNGPPQHEFGEMPLAEKGRRGPLGRLLSPKETDVEAPREPLYPRLLGLRHVHPNGWQRAVLVEGMAFVGLLWALADKASWWAPVVLPVVTAGVVKFHDVLTGVIGHRPSPGPDAQEDSGADPDEPGGAAEEKSF